MIQIIQRRLILFTVLLLAVAGVSQNKVAAQPRKVVADKIVAKVGDKIILRSDVFNAVTDMQRQGVQMPENPECAIIEAQLIQKGLVLQAEKDSLVVSDDEIEASLENRIRGFIQQYGSREILEEVAGKSIYQLKEDFREPFREQNLADQMRRKIVENVKITPTEVKEHFEYIPKDSLPFYESELEVSQIVAYPKANRDVESYVTRELNDFKRQVENGSKSFEQLAKQYTEDPGSKESGGQYSLNRNDKIWDPTFLSAAFKLKEGQISPVIKSKFGLHIIQLVSRAGDDAIVRHILKIPPVTDQEVKESIIKLDSVRTKLVAGTLGFGEAVSKFSDDEGSKFNGGQVQARDGSNYVTIDQMDKDMVLALKNMKVGDFSDPLVFTDERGKKGVRIINLKSRTEPHRESLKEDYSKIAARALEQKKTETLEKWFSSHIPNFYVHIDPEFQECDSVKEWVKTIATN